MEEPTSHIITRLLARTSDGDGAARAELYRIIYAELERQARRFLREQPANHTLEPSALVNEAYLKMLDHEGVQFQNRSHFLATAARAMRWILVDHARGKGTKKRKAAGRPEPLEKISVQTDGGALDVLDLHEALDQLASVDRQAVQIVELRFYAGLSVKETANVLGLSVRTVEREWQFVRAWLRGALQ